MAAALERTLSGLEPNAPIKVQSWPDALGGTLFPARAATLSVGVMGLLAAMLAVTGIFGMAAYNVSRRMKELGIRVALGARTTHVMSAAVGRPIVLLGVGSLAGLLLGALRQPVAGTDRLSGKPDGSRGRGRRRAHDGAAGHCRVRHSRPASACGRSIQTHAGRVRQVSQSWPESIRITRWFSLSET